MKNKKSRRIRKILLWFFSIVILIPALLFTVFALIINYRQNETVDEIVTTFNEGYRGEIAIGNTDVSPFSNFPYISIELNDVFLYENKVEKDFPLVDVKHISLGFNVMSLVSGNTDVEYIKVDSGLVDIIRYFDGGYNIAHALSPEVSDSLVQEANDTSSTDFNINLKEIELNDVHVIKHDETTFVVVETIIEHAESNFKKSSKGIHSALNGAFVFNLVHGFGSEIAQKKHFKVKTEVDFDTEKEFVTLQPSEIALEDGIFEIAGTADIRDSLNLDLEVSGKELTFDLFFAFAPDTIRPTLKLYDTGGKVFFNTIIKGKSLHDHVPLVVMDFGCENAFFNNKETHKKIHELGFVGKFTNGKDHSMETSEFSIKDFKAIPDKGDFRCDLSVKNFNKPDINAQVSSHFDLDFISSFLNLKDMNYLQGDVALKMNFNDVIDLEHIDSTIQDFDKSYFTELKVNNLRGNLPMFPVELNRLDMKVLLEGDNLDIKQFNMKVGNSDVSLTGSLTNIPSIIHQSDEKVTSRLNISSNLIDIKELTAEEGKDSSGMDEQIQKFKTQLSFSTTGKNLMAGMSLPKGEFYIDDFYANLKHYPHTFHDFEADIIIGDSTLKLVDFKGEIDKSDFDFSGWVDNYPLMVAQRGTGKSTFHFDLVSNSLHLDDLAQYKKESFIPEDYKHEVINKLNFHGNLVMRYQDSLQGMDFDFYKVEAKLQMHPLKLINFHGKGTLENDHLSLRNIGGRMGRSSFETSMDYFIGSDPALQKKENFISLRADKLDLDQLLHIPLTKEEIQQQEEIKKTIVTKQKQVLNRAKRANPFAKPEAVQIKEEVVKTYAKKGSSKHEQGFNMYAIPFPDLKVSATVADLNYKTYKLKDIRSEIRIQKDHIVYLDKLMMRAAGGRISMKGKLDATNKDNVHLIPEIDLTHVDLDQLMIKFENFGQDHLVSDNLKGDLTMKIDGDMHLYPDLVPDLDGSDLDVELLVLNGQLKNYGLLKEFADYFANKNLETVRFDTLRNTLKFKKGTLIIPQMTIESSLGHMELSGKQDLDLNMEYYVRIPLKLVTGAASQKLFGNKSADNSDQVDEIVKKDDGKRVRYVNMKVIGHIDDYKISLGRDKRKKDRRRGK